MTSRRHGRRNQSPRLQMLERILPVIAVGVLALGLLYTFGFIYYVPYPGFDYDSRWQVVNFDVDCTQPPADIEIEAWCDATGDLLQIGDQILSIGGVSRNEYENSYFHTPFGDAQPGDRVQLVVQRDDAILEVAWPVLGPTIQIQLMRMAGLLLFLPFWLAGTAVYLFFRPKDVRWCLLIGFNYVAALWILTGSIAFSQVWGSSILAVILSWMLAPIYVHLHMELVAAERDNLPLHRTIASSWYGLAALSLVLQLTKVLPSTFHYIGLLGGIFLSLLILTLRTDWSKPSSLRAVTIQIFTGIVVAFAPGLLLWLTPMVVGASGPGTATLWISTASIALLPFFYVYALYKNRLGASEVRANRALSFYSFLVLYATGFMLVFVTMNRWAQLDSRAMTFSLIASIVCLFLALMAWAPYQRLLNFLVYGNSYEPGTVIQEFANEIPRAMNRDKLAELISNRVAKSLLIRQSALVQVSESFVSLMYAEHIDLDLSKWERDEVLALLDRAERYIPPDGWSDPKRQWIRLIIPIRLDQQLLGIWLLGKKDPDDFYPQRDINVLSTLANQIAVSMETVRLFETLRSRAEELEHAYLELRRADRLKDEFIRNISHELRTPLTAVLGYSELLLVGESGDLTPGQEELLEIVIQHTHDIIRLVNSIIAMQQAKLRTIKKQPVSVYEVARASIQESQIFAQRQRSKQEAPVEFALKCPEDLPLVLANRAQLSQVFDNLLSNAVKFSPNGGTIEVSARATSHKLPALVAGSDIPKMVERPVIEVCVRDQGIGIPEDEIGHIWEQFYQIDGSATRRFGGTGLGLALARDIIESHGGEIWVESQVGVGSAFYFVLPVEKHLSDPKIQSEEITTSNNNTSLSEITAS